MFLWFWHLLGDYSDQIPFDDPLVQRYWLAGEFIRHYGIKAYREKLRPGLEKLDKQWQAHEFSMGRTSAAQDDLEKFLSGRGQEGA